MKTNSGMEIPEAGYRGVIVPLDGRRETHPAWMAGTIIRLDPFQNTLPCWDHKSATAYAIRSWQFKQMSHCDRCESQAKHRVQVRSGFEIETEYLCSDCLEAVRVNGQLIGGLS